MDARGRRGAIVVALSLLVVLLGASAARADSLVYMKAGNVWISHGDGSNARQVTGAPNTWSWPTEDNSGKILVAGGQEVVNAGIEDTAGSEVYRLNQKGTSLSTPQQTPGSQSTVNCPTYPPQNLRVAPDGAHFVYHAWFCDHDITFIGTVGGAGFSGSEYMSDFVYPYWVDNSDFVVSRGGVPLQDSDGEWWVHDLGDKPDYGYNWFGDPASYAGDPGGWATGFDGIAVSRDGTKMATLEEDGANWFGAAHKVVIALWSAGGAPTPAHPTVPTPTFKCDFKLPADPDTTLWYDNAGPTFSPDGTRLAFAEPDGIHIANVSSLSCASAPLVIPGATQPFWSAGDEAADAGYPFGGGGKDVKRGGGEKPTIGSLSIQPKRFAVAKAATALSARKRRQAHQGATVRYTLSEPAKVTLVVEQASTGRKKGHGCVKVTKSLKHARHCVLLRTKGTLTRSGVSGANQLAFSGRLGTRKLTRGSYELVVSAVDAAGDRSAQKTVRFTIVKR